MQYNFTSLLKLIMEILRSSFTQNDIALVVTKKFTKFTRRDEPAPKPGLSRRQQRQKMNKIVLGRADCGRLENAIHKEWLVTNGLGGYAAGTISGANTRRYHGLLVAALRPPLGRTLLVAKIDTQAHYDGDGKIYPLATNEYADHTIDPHGYQHLESFHLEGLIPVWVYALADARLEQRVWIAHGHNTIFYSGTLKAVSFPRQALNKRMGECSI